MHISGPLNGVFPRLLLIACLAAVALAGSLAPSVAVASDPSRPTSDRDPGPPGGGGGEPERRVALGIASPERAST